MEDFRIREMECDGKKVPEKYIVCFNDYISKVVNKQLKEQLAEKDKEIRKQVCDEIRDRLKDKSHNYYPSIDYVCMSVHAYKSNEIKEILDQIEGNANGK